METLKSLSKPLATVVPVTAAVWLLASIITIVVADADANWRGLVLAQALTGLFLVCIMAALRDGYGLRPDALIPFKGRQTNMLSIAGALVLVPALLAVIIGNVGLLRLVFVTTTVIFVLKACYVEYLRWRRSQTIAA